MDPIGAITLDTAGAVTRPASMPFNLPSADVQTGYNRYALVSAAPMPSERGVMFANGVDRIRHYIGSTAYDTGLIAPPDAPVATPTGAKAYTILDCSGHTLATGSFIYLITGRSLTTYDPKYHTIFTTGSIITTNYNTIVYDGTTDGALTQLRKFINQSGVEGVDYYTAHDFSSELSADEPNLTSDTIRINAVSYGSTQNNWICEYSGTQTGSNPRFENTLGSEITKFTAGDPGEAGLLGAGTYQYAYAHVRKADGAISGLSPYVEASTISAVKINLSTLTTNPNDSSVTYQRLYRTTTGGGLFYRVDEVAAAAYPTATTYKDNVTDDTITSFGAVAYDSTLYRSYAGGIPPRVRYLAHYQGSWFGAGALLAADYSQGTVTLTKGSRTVTVSGGYPRKLWMGRLFEVSGVSETYRIISVDESAKTLMLDRPYEDDPPVSPPAYTVRDDRDPYELFWSEAGLPNNWPAQNSLKGPSSPDGKGCTGLFAAFESLIYFTRQSVWRISGSGGLFQVSLISDKCGCVSGHTVVMDGSGMFWLGQDGVYGWSGSGEPVNLTTPLQQEVAVRGQDDTIARLSLSHAHRAIGINDQTRKELRWYVPLDGERTNRYAIVLDNQSGIFSLDTCEDVTWAITVQGPDGEDHVLTGDITGAIYEQGLSTADGGYGIEPVNTVSSSTTRTITVSGTPFSTTDNGYWGCPVWHVSASGQFVRNCVATNTSSVLTYRRFMAAPSASTQFVLGGILLWIQTGKFDFGDRFREKIVPAYIVSHSPQPDGQYFFFSSYDQASMSIPTLGWASGDLTAGNTQDDFGPRRRFRARKMAVLHAYGIACVEPGCDPSFSSVTIEVRGPSNLDI